MRVGRNSHRGKGEGVGGGQGAKRGEGIVGGKTHSS